MENVVEETLYPGLSRGRLKTDGWTIENGQMDGPTMAAGSSMTWTHCSVRYKVTSGVNRHIRVDATKHPRTLPVRADATCSSPPSHPSRSPARVRVDARKKLKIIYLFMYLFLVVVAGWKREKKISFQSPRSLRSPSEATRRRRFFRPSSPSHPSKLYSSLGWLNSKVPKPFSPFTLRLIDVDGF
jgi:hypothetical protein